MPVIVTHNGKNFLKNIVVLTKLFGYQILRESLLNNVRLQTEISETHKQSLIFNVNGILDNLDAADEFGYEK